MMKRFAALSLIALMLGAAPAAFAAGAGSSGGAGGGSGSGAPSGSGSNPGMGTQQAPGGALQNSPRGTDGASPGTTAPGTTSPGTTQPRASGPVNTPSEASTALQSRGYSNVQGLVRTGDTYRGRATRDGRMVVVEIDARTGAVREVSG